jgi:hypothetical protein
MTQKTKEVAWAFGMIVLGFVSAWQIYGNFAAFESGADPAMKLWKPLAYIYNLGPPWTLAGKWLAIGLPFALGAFGLLMLWWELKPAAPADPGFTPPLAPATLEVYITPEQLAERAEVEVEGPRGRVRVKIPGNFAQQSSVRVLNQGAHDRQDLLVRFVVRSPSA